MSAPEMPEAADEQARQILREMLDVLAPVSPKARSAD